MKILALTLSILLCYGTASHAQAESKTESIKQVGGDSGFFKKITPEFLFGYTDFNFNSVSDLNFNKYSGTSYLYSTGGDHIPLGKKMMAGIYYFGIDTALNAEFLFNPGDVTTTDQTIHNNTLFGHILRIFTSEIFADLAGGIGYNKFSTSTQIATLPSPLVAHSNNNNVNWFASFNAIYRKTWKSFLLRANLGALFSEINTDEFFYFFPTSNTFQSVQPIVNKATLILENAELGYFVTPLFMPFINGGLIQVVQFSNSRLLLNPDIVINGSLPQLNMNKDGFRLGGGFTYTHKNVTLRIEEKYYNAGGTFQSYQTLAALEYQFS